MGGFTPNPPWSTGCSIHAGFPASGTGSLPGAFAPTVSAALTAFSYFGAGSEKLARWCVTVPPRFGSANVSPRLRDVLASS